MADTEPANEATTVPHRTNDPSSLSRVRPYGPRYGRGFVLAALLLFLSWPAASGGAWITAAVLWIAAAALLVRTLRLGLSVTPDELIVRNYLRTLRLPRPVTGRAVLSRPLSRDGLTPVLVLELADGRRIRVSAFSGKIRTLSMVEEQPTPTTKTVALFAERVAPALRAAGIDPAT